MQNIKKPWQHFTSRANETHNPAHPGGDWYWACWNYFRLSILSNSKKMASPSVPSISRVETSSESSSDSTSTTTSTVSEHSKTSNIINRYSCSVERGLYWVPYGFRWFDLDWIIMLYRITHKLASIPTATYIAPSTRNTQHYILPYARTHVFKTSFFPSTIKIWNNLQPVITNSTTIPQLRQALQSTPTSGRRGAPCSAGSEWTPHAY